MNFYYLMMSHCLRLDKGTETGKMATIHCYLRSGHNDVENPEDTVIYGSSNSNKVSYFPFFLKLELSIPYESDLSIHAYYCTV